MKDNRRNNFAKLIDKRRKKLVLVIYDIVDDRRRRKMVELLESYGIRVQMSAFEALIENRQYNEMIKRIEKEIDKDVDNIRIYKLNGNNEVLLMGRTEAVYNENEIIV